MVLVQLLELRVVAERLGRTVHRLNATLATYAGYSFAKYRYFGRKPVMMFMSLSPSW